MSVIRITPQPTEAEVVAIMVAYEALWPSPAADEPPSLPAPRWRFSGRWWSAPAATRRPRLTQKR